MLKSAFPAIVLSGVCLLAEARAQGPSTSTSPDTEQAKPSQVYVWPVMKGCQPNQEATDRIIARLHDNKNLDTIYRLTIPEGDPGFGNCTGSRCAQMLSSDGCARRSGILIGGEVQELPCQAVRDKFSGCTGSVTVQVRLFAMRLKDGQPGKEDYRYWTCTAGQCDPQSVAKQVADLAASLVLAQTPPGGPTSPYAFKNTFLDPNDCQLPPAYSSAVAPPSGMVKLPLGCIPYVEPRCTAPAVVKSSASDLPVETPPPIVLPPPKSRALSNSIYITEAAVVATAIGLSIADAKSPGLKVPVIVGTSSGTAEITGWLQPAMWTAWGVSVAVAIPTVVLAIVQDYKGARERTPEHRPAVKKKQPSCPVSDQVM